MERATDLKNVHVHFVATTTRLSPDAQKALALRAASGDRAAEAQALDSIRPVSLAIVNAMVASNSRLRPHKADLISEALTLTVEAIRAYNGRSQLAGWVTMFVGGRLRRHAWKEYTADVPGVRISHHGPADFEQPIFKGCASLSEPDSVDVPSLFSDDSSQSTRAFIGNLLRRLTHFEREVIRRRRGIRPGRRLNRGAYEAASGLRESCSVIAADYGVSDEYIRRVEIEAMKKLGAKVNKPERAQIRKAASPGNPPANTRLRVLDHFFGVRLP